MFLKINVFIFLLNILNRRHKLFVKFLVAEIKEEEIEIYFLKTEKKYKR